MKAAVYKKYGSPGVLKITEIGIPVPKAREVLIKIKAASLAFSDSAVLSGHPLISRLWSGFFTPHYSIPGSDFAGTGIVLTLRQKEGEAANGQKYKANRTDLSTLGMGSFYRICPIFLLGQCTGKGCRKLFGRLFFSGGLHCFSDAVFYKKR